MQVLGGGFGGHLVAAKRCGNTDAAADALKKGKACLEKKDFDAAIAAFTEAIRLDPKDAVAYSERGRAYVEKGDLDKAIADCSEAIHLDPKLAKAYRRPGIRPSPQGQQRQGHRRL